MIKLSKSTGIKLELADAKVLLIGTQATEQDILARMFMGFGVNQVRRCDDFAEAMDMVRDETFDLLVVEAAPRDEQAYDLTRSIRRLTDRTRKQTPMILACGHVRSKDVFKARDCGANLMVTKPVSAQTMFDHILWLAQDHRSFLEADGYIGPDRRYQSIGPPAGTSGRRRNDLSETVGDPTDPNLSQDAVDDFFSPKKVSV